MDMNKDKGIYGFTVTTNKGGTLDFADLRDKVLLIVNTASKCGYTKQYAGLEALYKKYKDRGLVVLGFPCNQFGGQDPGTDDEIASFCEINFGVTFPLMAKIKVNGKEADPLFAFLKERAPGEGGSLTIKWNFTKFLVSRDGAQITRFVSKDTPESIDSSIEALL